MAALNFPATPTLNQIYTANGNRWKWDGVSWVSSSNVAATTATITTTATTQTSLMSFAAASYGSASVAIQATQGTLRHTTELLVVHDGTTAYATEYGLIYTGSKLFTVDVDISAGNVRVLITPLSATSTVFRSSFTLIVS